VDHGSIYLSRSPAHPQAGRTPACPGIRLPGLHLPQEARSCR
jgi:hypothetical protein